jgi:hypothetical protein
MNEVLRSEGTNVIKVFLVDRLAVNTPYELLSTEYESFFNLKLSRQAYDECKNKYIKEIQTRQDEIREFIYSSGTYAKLLNITDILYNKVKEGQDSPKELSTLAATLRGYLDTLNQMSTRRDVTEVKQQNNFIILQTLAREGLIEIKDERQLKYLIDGETSE